MAAQVIQGMDARNPCTSTDNDCKIPNISYNDIIHDGGIRNVNTYLDFDYKKNNFNILKQKNNKLSLQEIARCSQINNQINIIQKMYKEGYDTLYANK